MKKNRNYLIIPDVHGRSFWKEKVYEVLENNETDTHIVFLGDYLDPYPYEWDDFELDCDAPDYRAIAIIVFEEIIDLKKKYPNQITLLLGNHDCGYIWRDVCSCRRDRIHYTDIKYLFESNMDLFDLAYNTEIGDKKYLFTHAGLHKHWFDLVFGEKDNYDNVADYLNNWLHTDQGNIEECLGMYSYFRGYIDNNYGSCIWADLREWIFDLPYAEDNKTLGFYQIFSHTQLEEEPIIRDSFACLDVRRYFILTQDNVLQDPQRPAGKAEYLLNEITQG